MKLLITAFDGSAGNVLYDYVQQTMEIPHVPLQVKFDNDFETETDFIISVIRHPRDIVSFNGTKEYGDRNIILKDYQDFIKYNLDYDITTEIIQQYTKYLNNVNNKSNLIFSYYDIVNSIDKIIEYIFDILNLDEQNYKNKTGRNSLRDDVINNIKNVQKPIYPKIPISDSLDSKNEKLENANIEYDIAFNKAVKFDN